MVCRGLVKQTFAGKLANKLKKEVDARPLMIAADIYRPAAIDQLKTLGQQIDVPVFALGTEVPAVEIVRQGLEQAKANHNDYVLIDTAGRLQIDELLMNELRDVKALAQPNEILLVIDAMIGQEAANVAREFNDQLEVTGSSLQRLTVTLVVVLLFLFVISLENQSSSLVLVKRLLTLKPSTLTVWPAVFSVWEIC